MKHILALLGLIQPHVRLPIVPPSETSKAEAANLLAGLSDEALTNDEDCWPAEQKALTNAALTVLRRHSV